jgi:hypothetical protein
MPASNQMGCVRAVRIMGGRTTVSTTADLLEIVVNRTAGSLLPPSRRRTTSRRRRRETSAAPQPGHGTGTHWGHSRGPTRVPPEAARACARKMVKVAAQSRRARGPSNPLRSPYARRQTQREQTSTRLWPATWRTARSRAGRLLLPLQLLLQPSREAAAAAAAAALKGSHPAGTTLRPPTRRAVGHPLPSQPSPRSVAGYVWGRLTLADMPALARTSPNCGAHAVAVPLRASPGAALRHARWARLARPP